MKKLLSAALVIVMTLTLAFAPVSYAATTTVTLNGASIDGLLDMLSDGMPSTPQDRVQTFNVLNMYLSTSTNLENLITVVEELDNYANNATVQGDAGLKAIIDNLVIKLGGLANLTAKKDEMIFVLSVLKALPDDHRVAAVNDFRTNRGVQLSSDETFQTALANIYDQYVTDEAQAYLSTHNVDDDAILRLAGAFKDNVMFTKGKSKGFALYSVDSTFESNLATAINEHFSAINGTAITASNAADVALDAIVDVLNSLSDLESDLKTVLGNNAVGLYKVSSSSKDDDNTGTVSPGTIFIPTGSIDPSTPTIPMEPPATQPIYSDIADHWADTYITSLSKRGIFNGYEDGSFRPEQKITREEIAVAMMRALGLEEAAANAPKTDFADGESISAWARDAVNLMVELGIFTGYDDNSFKPGQVITREELTAVLIRKIGVGDADDHGFIDAEHIGDWAEEYIKHAVEIGLVNGYPDGSFKPANAVTRGETAKMLYGFINHIG